MDSRLESAFSAIWDYGQQDGVENDKLVSMLTSYLGSKSVEAKKRSDQDIHDKVAKTAAGFVPNKR